MSQSIALAVTESSQVGSARRAAMQLAADLKCEETTRSAIGIVVTELANNLYKHGNEGELLLRPLQEGGFVGIEALAIDKGPGIGNVERTFEDGYSTAGTPGTGMGAIRRLSSFFDIYSVPGKGTVVVARIGTQTREAKDAQGTTEIEIGALNVAYPGERESGDAWSVCSTPQQHKVVVADGLGHGVAAAEASQEMIRLFEQNPRRRTVETLEAAHRVLTSTRGAAASITEIDMAAHQVRYAGIGNISACLLTAMDRRNMVSHNGTIGHSVRKIQEFDYPWSYGTLLILHSDGLATHWSLDTYPGLSVKHPALIAGILYRDFKRGRDDVSIVVVREARS